MSELSDLILSHATRPSNPTLVPGLTLFRSDLARSLNVKVLYMPMVSVMAQGEKDVVLGDVTFHCTPSHYLVSSVDLAVCGTAFHAAQGVPFLSLMLELDLNLVRELAIETGRDSEPERAVRGIALGRLDEPLRECFVRLIKLLDTPEDVPHLAPLIKREIYFRLLRGEHCHMLRDAVTGAGSMATIAEAIRFIRARYREQFSAKSIARAVNISVPALNRRFRTVTATSPLQYHKQIRMQEARRLLFLHGQDAATTAFQVGYASASQFSREYARTFGRPPIADAAFLRAEITTNFV
jgi:AraC-like DNA-binding protein